MSNTTPQLPRIVHQLHVSVVSPEEASDGVAELWAGGALFGFTHIEESDLVLRIEPCPDGDAVVVSVPHLAEALAEAERLLRQEVSA
jgi:hypothetical protein